MQFQDKVKAIQTKIFVNGQFIDSKGGKNFQVINPADQSVIGQAVAASQEDVDIAVRAAHQAFYNGKWAKIDSSQRAKMLYKFSQLILANLQWLAHFQTLNNGKPLMTSKNEDITFTAGIYRYFAGVADKIKGNTLSMSKPFFGMTKKQPIGVVAQIIPWNYPLLMMAWKVAPALAAGCTIVLKPAEQTPFTALMLGHLFIQAGFPSGVINIVTGFGETGSLLAQHKLVRKISFTGSTQVGYLIMRNSHKHTLKPVTLQLGGKSANIILPDADIKQAAQQACILFSNAGQSCIAGSRTFVHESLFDQFVKKAKELAQYIKVGDPFEETTQQGPQISKQQFDKIMAYIESGKQQGAKLITGGSRVGQKGFFVQPTIFTDVEDHMKIAKQQIFGPVMCIFKWKTDDQVIKRANSLPYGLGAGVVTKDINKILYYSEKLHAGTVYVNCYDYTQGCTPFGGYKDSGIGKDLGQQGIESYLLTKTVIIRGQHQ